jgi:hypothetical protein
MSLLLVYAIIITFLGSAALTILVATKNRGGD